MTSYTSAALRGILQTLKRTPLPSPLYRKLTDLNIIRPIRRGTRAGVKPQLQKPIEAIAPTRRDHNLRPIPCDTSVKQPYNKINIATVNMRSIRNKCNAYLEHLIDNKIDLCLVTETWLKETDGKVLGTLRSNGFEFDSCPRPDRTGGGIGLSYRENLKVRRVKANSQRSFESAEWIVTCARTTAAVVGVYRPPSSTANQANVTTFIEEMEEYLTDILADHKNIFMLGDFNLHINDDTDADAKKFLDTLNAFGLDNHVTIPTHESGNSLDLIITKHEQSAEVLQIWKGETFSDHDEVVATISIMRPEIERKRVQTRSLKKIDHTQMDEDIQELVKEAENIQDVHNLVELYNRKLSEILDKHAPIKEKIVTVRPQYPWYTEEAKRAKNAMRKAERQMRVHKTAEARSDYKACRNRYNQVLNDAKDASISEKVLECQKNSKKLYALIANITGKKTNNPMPETTSDQELAEQFAEFFIGKIEKIRNELAQFPQYTPPRKDTTIFGKFNTMSCEDIRTILSSMKVKACELDPLPASVFKAHSDTLLPLLTKIVNSSLCNSMFPMDWKCAILRPLLKKAGLEEKPSNYRPVSNLNCLSKLTEKAAISQFNEHIETGNLMPDYQSAYRKNYSCETALVRLHNDILTAMNKQEVTALCAIDLSAAFDTVDHDILLAVLETRFGISDTALNWFDNYLRPRSFKVSVGESKSTPKQLEFSVPQGSCLGPLLYSAYASTLEVVVESQDINIAGFADDHVIWDKFTTANRNTEGNSIMKLEATLNDIKKWMDMNRLKMNESKTEFILFGSSRQLQKCNTNTLNVNGTDVSRSDTIKYLGVNLDQELQLRSHIITKCRIASLNLFRIKSIRKHLTDESCKQVIHGLVISHLDYANALYMGLPDKDIKVLQRVQNMAAKVVLNKRKYDSNRDALFELHWLPIKERIKYKVLTLVFKALHNQAPQYIKDLLKLKQTPYSLRSEDQLELDPPMGKTTFIDRSFSVFGPTSWNDLPTSLRLQNDLNIFKKELKTYLFRKVFY